MPVTRTAGILAYGRLKTLAANRAGHSADICRILAYYLLLIGVNPCRLKVSQRG